MRHRFGSALLTLLMASPCAFAQTDVPPFVATLISHFKAAPPKASPGSIWRYIYRGETVYYVPPLFCCDISSYLYDAKGIVLCRPDGGFVGIGDGKCPDFLKERSQGELLWSDHIAEGSP
jgi:hypothetical protein